jgi:lysyl oxidase
MNRRRRSTSLVMLLAVCLLVEPLAATATTFTHPRIRLIAPDLTVRLPRWGDGPVSLQLPVYVASLGAPFEVDVWRNRYLDPIQMAQKLFGDNGKTSLVPLALDATDGWSGLDGFFRLTLTDRLGSTVARKAFLFCPNAWDQQRVADSGPLTPTYPQYCGYNPFTRAMPWGIDEGWAVSAFNSFAPRSKIPDGRYVATVEIAPVYRDLFGIGDADASVKLHVRVVTHGDPCQVGCEVARSAGSDRRSLTVAPTVPAPPAESLPNLRVLPAYGINTFRDHGRDYLAFGADVWNAGPGHLVVEGFRQEGEALMDAFQYFLTDGEVVGRVGAGQFEYDDRSGHNHWHFRQFATYSLVDAAKSEVVRSDKEAFCLAPTDAIDLLHPGALWRPEKLGFGTACGYESSLWIRETLPAGWGDTYQQWLPGQSFDITDLPNGTYFIEVQANPLGRLVERRADDNVSYRKVYLRGRPAARIVKVPPYHGIDTEAAYGSGLSAFAIR